MNPDYRGALMVQGTSSDAGKSMLVTALCRLLARDGIRVAPFKPQNMALNSAVTPEGGEIGRAQAVQAFAARLEPCVHFNPVLLKPNSDTGCQVILHGQVATDMEANSYHGYKPLAMRSVLASWQWLQQRYSCLVVEGAGSPAEVNLRDGDIANMGFAEAVDCPVILIADIDRGGVFAQLVGTLALLSPSEQQRIKGFVINRFRGDIGLLEPGLRWLEQKTGKPVLGVLPYLLDLRIAAEDAIAHVDEVAPPAKRLKIVVPVLPRISNHTDFDPLALHPDVSLQFVALHDPLPACDLVILPGSKNVRADLEALRAAHWDQAMARHLRYGGKVFGICGGYQMLGQMIEDPFGMEGPPGSSQGLGWLPVHTRLANQKQLCNVSGTCYLSGTPTAVRGYEIHLGVSSVAPNTAPLWQRADGSFDGCISLDRQVAGGYLHGLFDQPQLLQQLLHWMGLDSDLQIDYRRQQDAEIDRLADCVASHLDMHAIRRFLGLEGEQNESRTG